MFRLLRWAALAACLCLPAAAAAIEVLPGEYVTTRPIVDQGILYIASFDEPWRHGHLRAIDIKGLAPIVLWDAAEKVPLPGTGRDPGWLPESDPPGRIDRDNRFRSLFTNHDDTLVPLTAATAGLLQNALGAVNASEAEQLLHTLRGRGGTSPQVPAGSFDVPYRLGAISRSSPRLVGRNPTRSIERDRVLYVGAEDGLLHAILASRWDQGGGDYLHNDPAGGTELWGYLPGSFLPYLKGQQRSESAATLQHDGTPATGEVFVSLAGDGRRRWHTLLAATCFVTGTGRGSLFVLDVSDPYQPGVLWEGRLPGEAMGRSRGAMLSAGRRSMTPTLYLTADFAPESSLGGAQLVAVEATTGRLLWQFSAAYDPSASAVNAAPAVPALMDRDANGDDDTLLIGDMAGRLWAIDRADGRALGDAPVFVVPTGAAEPIGAGVAVHGRVAIFGTGGIAHADPNGRYAIYAVEILPDSGRLLWSYQLAEGEQIWDTPSFDAAGNLYFATAVDYLQPERPASPTSGRVVVLDASGVERLSRPAGAATIGSVVTAPDLAIAVSLTGEVTQFGAASGSHGSSLAGPGQVRLLSWRQR